MTRRFFGHPGVSRSEPPIDLPDYQEDEGSRAWRPRCTRLVLVAVVLAPWSLVLAMILWMVSR